MGYFLGRSPVSVDAQVTDRGSLQGIGVRCRLGRDLVEGRGGLSLQRVARGRPAAALPAEHDPMHQLVTPGM